MDTPTFFPSHPFPRELADRLLQIRIVIVSGLLDAQQATRVVAQLTSMAGASDAPVTIYLSAQGTDLSTGEMLFDALQYVPARVRIVATGQVADAGLLTYAAVPREDRYSLPNAHFRLHLPDAPDLPYHSPASGAAVARAQRDQVVQLLAGATGQTPESIRQALRSTLSLDAEAARTYGLVGHLVQHLDEIPPHPEATSP